MPLLKKSTNTTSATDLASSLLLLVAKHVRPTTFAKILGDLHQANQTLELLPPNYFNLPLAEALVLKGRSLRPQAEQQAELRAKRWFAQFDAVEQSAKQRVQPAQQAQQMAELTTLTKRLERLGQSYRRY